MTADTWLDKAVAAVAADPLVVGRLFPAVGRHVGRTPIEPEAVGGPLHTPTLDDTARAVLLDALVAAGGTGEVEALYRHGDTAERRGVLRWLGCRTDLPPEVPAGELVDDALRTNDPRLLAAALGPATVGRLEATVLRQAVLKCVFSGVPLAGIGGLAARADAELTRMLAAYVLERVAAGREVPADVWPFMAPHPPADLLAALRVDADHPVAERRQVARAALSAAGQSRQAMGR